VGTPIATAVEVVTTTDDALEITFDATNTFAIAVDRTDESATSDATEAEVVSEEEDRSTDTTTFDKVDDVTEEEEVETDTPEIALAVVDAA